jgi:hypothetical protein
MNTNGVASLGCAARQRGVLIESSWRRRHEGEDQRRAEREHQAPNLGTNGELPARVQPVAPCRRQSHIPCRCDFTIYDSCPI